MHGSFTESLLSTLIARQRFQTIIDGKAFQYLTLLGELMSIPDFRASIFKMAKEPFIPGDKGKMKGSMIDTISPFGLFMRTSVLGMIPGYYHQESEAFNRFEERLLIEFGNERITKDKLKYYSNLQNEFYEKQTEVFKIFLKKDSQKHFFEWIYYCIKGNLQRAKLGSRLQNANNANLSHDGLMVNIYMCLLNLCKVILSK